jgi:pyruvate dehydrogenase E2 component (dihydrolipoamide acetyltransferase)
VPTEVKLPRLGQGMESGTIVRWLKAEGDEVRKREPLYELDTDKVTQEVEAEADGVLLRIVVAEGEVPVGATVAVIGAEGEDVSELVTASANGGDGGQAPDERGLTPQGSVPAAPEPHADDGQMEGTDAPAREDERERGRAASAASERGQTPAGSVPAAGGRVKASPLARRIARERGIDLAAVRGTGPEGRVVADDVERASAAQPAEAPLAVPAGEVEVVELTSVRRTIARRLTEAWAAPVFQLGVSADATELLGLRERLVERLEEGDVKPTVNDVLVKLAAVALTRHRAVNAVFTGDQIHRFGSAHVGIAVAAPQGLVVPVLREAQLRTIQELARARADLVGRAAAGKLTLQDLEGGTFTISNLGMYGVEQFVAVLNPPQVAILAVGAAKEEAVVVDGELTIAPVLRLTLTCDHRAIDGAEGAGFLQTLVALIEQPALAL